MVKLFDKLRLLGSVPKPLTSGFYVYHSPETDPTPYRLHLRVEPDGEGVLIVNASSILHLNQTATEFAYYLMQEKEVDEISQRVSERFDAPLDVITDDVASFKNQLMQFIYKSDQEPITNFGFEPLTDINDISAPYRLDCCLTLKDSVESSESKELDTDSWKDIIQKSYKAGIPHLVFYGGEPTLREDLIPLLRYCEDLGLVTGLVSAGQKLADDTYLGELLTSGLDHLMVPFDPMNVTLNQALIKILPLDLYTCVNLVIQPGVDYSKQISELNQLGTNAFSLVPASEIAFDTYVRATENVLANNVTLVNDLPLPISMLELNDLRNAADHNNEKELVIVRVMPNGDLYSHPFHGQKLGNIAAETWDAIWERRFQDKA